MLIVLEESFRVQLLLFKKSLFPPLCPPTKARTLCRLSLRPEQDRVLGKGMRPKLGRAQAKEGLGIVAAGSQGVVPSVVQLVLQASELCQLVELLELSVRLMADQ